MTDADQAPPAVPDTPLVTSPNTAAAFDITRPAEEAPLGEDYPPRKENSRRMSRRMSVELERYLEPATRPVSGASSHIPKKAAAPVEVLEYKMTTAFDTPDMSAVVTITNPPAVLMRNARASAFMIEPAIQRQNMAKAFDTFSAEFHLAFIPLQTQCSLAWTAATLRAHRQQQHRHIRGRNSGRSSQNSAG